MFHRTLLSKGRTINSVTKKVRASATKMATQVQTFIDTVNTEYEKAHLSYEENFWSTKMALTGNSADALVETKKQLDSFLGDKAKLEEVRKLRKEFEAQLTADQKRALDIFARTFESYIIEDPAAVQIKDRLLELEANLQQKRNTMKLGYVHPTTGEFTQASSVQLATTMRTHADEAVRKAGYEGLCSVGEFVAEDLAEIIRERNKLAKLQGFQCYYDMKCSQAEGFGKDVLFGILDGLVSKTDEINRRALANLEKDKGAKALLPWNRSYMLAGDIERRQDPYFPFTDAVDVWARSFAALHIEYKGTTMTLDLCDRQGKYSNGFCHWPQPAWRKSDGHFVPSKANFTSVASPNQVGSGKNALVTLMHEGGHAAHLANVDQPSPLFSQERAPTSVAYAENQSMFLDSLCSDADWLARYALSAAGEPLPWALIEESIRATHEYKVFMLRQMLAVCYLERAFYETPEAEMTRDKVLAIARETEARIQACASPRPLLSVPHILSDESSAYYHGYVLAEMSVMQTRAYFEHKYGRIVDNPKVGEELAEVYWRPGNSEMFLDLVQKLTGQPLTADAWVAELEKSTEETVREEREAYERAVKEGPKYKAGESVELGMRMVLVHGDVKIADSQEDGFAGACKKFKEWCAKEFPPVQAAA